MMEGLCFYFFQIPGNKGFYISCVTPNWRIFLFNCHAVWPSNIKGPVTIINVIRCDNWGRVGPGDKLVHSYKNQKLNLLVV